MTALDHDFTTRIIMNPQNWREAEYNCVLLCVLITFDIAINSTRNGANYFPSHNGRIYVNYMAESIFAATQEQKIEMWQQYIEYFTEKE
jgi:hypothetical protein